MGMGMRGGDKESQRAEEVRPETDGCGWVGGGWVGGVGRGTEGLQPGLVIGWMVGLSEDLGRGMDLREPLSLSGSC